MPRIVREAEVGWDGSLSRGSGVARAGTGSFELPIDLPARVEEPGSRTSPEELLAAAHAGCFTMSIAGEIARAGGTVERLDTHCTITMDEVPGKGHLVVASHVAVRVRADGIDADGLDRAAEQADRGCSFSALIRASASVTVRAELAT
jgi:osmotically inducible protein OsmC